MTTLLAPLPDWGEYGYFFSIINMLSSVNDIRNFYMGQSDSDRTTDMIIRMITERESNYLFDQSMIGELVKDLLPIDLYLNRGDKVEMFNKCLKGILNKLEEHGEMPFDYKKGNINIDNYMVIPQHRTNTVLLYNINRYNSGIMGYNSMEMNGINYNYILDVCIEQGIYVLITHGTTLGASMMILVTIYTKQVPLQSPQSQSFVMRDQISEIISKTPIKSRESLLWGYINNKYTSGYYYAYGTHKDKIYKMERILLLYKDTLLMGNEDEIDDRDKKINIVNNMLIDAKVLRNIRPKLLSAWWRCECYFNGFMHLLGCIDDLRRYLKEKHNINYGDLYNGDSDEEYIKFYITKMLLYPYHRDVYDKGIYSTLLNIINAKNFSDREASGYAYLMDVGELLRTIMNIPVDLIMVLNDIPYGNVTRGVKNINYSNKLWCTDSIAVDNNINCTAPYVLIFDNCIHPMYDNYTLVAIYGTNNHGKVQVFKIIDNKSSCVEFEYVAGTDINGRKIISSNYLDYYYDRASNNLYINTKISVLNNDIINVPCVINRTYINDKGKTKYKITMLYGRGEEVTVDGDNDILNIIRSEGKISYDVGTIAVETKNVYINPKKKYYENRYYNMIDGKLEPIPLKESEYFCEDGTPISYSEELDTYFHSNYHFFIENNNIHICSVGSGHYTYYAVRNYMKIDPMKDDEEENKKDDKKEYEKKYMTPHEYLKEFHPVGMLFMRTDN